MAPLAPPWIRYCITDKTDDFYLVFVLSHVNDESKKGKFYM